MPTSEAEWKETSEIAVNEIKTLKIVDASTYAHMGNLVLLCEQAVKFYEDLYRPRIRQTNQLADDLRRDLRNLQEEPSRWCNRGSAAMTTWRNEQKRIADEAAMKLRADEQKKVDDEKTKLAQAAADAGDTELAQSILEEHVEPAPVVVKPDVPKVDGISTRDDWKFEIEQPRLVPERFHRLEKNKQGEWSCKCVVDLGAEVRRMKESANIPGVRVWKVETTVKTI